MDCEAINRAKRLINTEGLHLVEHILLRPRCPEDCNDGSPRCLLPVCDGEPRINCTDWEWKETGDQDPCSEKARKEEPEARIFFHPQEDPYSFIATAILPAWPERFRKEENRIIVESLLYRETPAHILLRILWVNPQQFCALEYDFKKWTIWLSRGHNNKCITGDPSCDLIDHLFRKNIEDPYQCQQCVPCSPNITPPDPCFDPEPVLCDEDSWNVQRNIKKLFCWNGEQPPIIPKQPEGNTTLEDNPPANIEPVLEEKTSNQSPPPRFLNKRKADYERDISHVIRDSKNNELAKKTKEFIETLPHSVERYISIVNAIFKNEKKEKSKWKKLTSHQQQILFDSITGYYFDRLVYFGSDDDSLKEKLKAAFTKLRKRDSEIDALFERWYRPELDEYNSGITSIDIKKILTGKK
jgi:hypothetical protein